MSLLSHPDSLYNLARALSDDQTDTGEGMRRLFFGLRRAATGEVGHWSEVGGIPYTEEMVRAIIAGRIDDPGLSTILGAIHEIQMQDATWKSELRRLRVRFIVPPPTYASAAWPLIYSLIELADQAAIIIASDFRPSPKFSRHVQEMIAINLPHKIVWHGGQMYEVVDYFEPLPVSREEMKEREAPHFSDYIPTLLETIRKKSKDYFEVTHTNVVEPVANEVAPGNRWGVVEVVWEKNAPEVPF